MTPADRAKRFRPRRRSPWSQSHGTPGRLDQAARRRRATSETTGDTGRTSPRAVPRPVSDVCPAPSRSSPLASQVSWSAPPADEGRLLVPSPRGSSSSLTGCSARSNVVQSPASHTRPSGYWAHSSPPAMTLSPSARAERCKRMPPVPWPQGGLGYRRVGRTGRAQRDHSTRACDPAATDRSRPRRADPWPGHGRSRFLPADVGHLHLG